MVSEYKGFYKEVVKRGDSLAVTIPKEVIKILNLKVGDMTHNKIKKEGVKKKK